jgi:hypothetical protein
MVSLHLGVIVHSLLVAGLTQTSTASSTAAAAQQLERSEVHFKPGSGLVAVSADKAFRLAIRARAQVLYTAHESESWDNALELRRARVAFTGHAFGEHNKYKLEIAISSRDLGVRDGVATRSPLLDYVFTFDHVRDLTLQLGQYKVPFNRERVISSGDLQMIDRSIVNAELTLDRDLGFDLRSSDLFGLDLFRYYAGVYINAGQGAFEAKDFDFMYIVRFEVLPFGMFKDYVPVDFSRSETPKLSLGVAYAFLDEAAKDRGILGRAAKDAGTTDFNLGLVDVMFQVAGLSVQGEAIVRHGERNPGAAVDDAGDPIAPELPRNAAGAFLQAGYLIPDSMLEISSRIGLIRPFGDDSSLTKSNEVGAGVSYYFGEHPFKLQADYFRLWSLGGIEEGEHRIRVQLQAGL